MRRVLDAIFPRGSAWVPVIGGDFDALLNGLGDGLELLRAFVGSLAQAREPEETFILEDLEREYGVVTDIGLTEAVRRTYLHGVKYGAIGLGTAGDVQSRLQAAGFTNVFVYQNDPAIDPDSFAAPGIELVVNGILEDHPDNYLIPDNIAFWPFIFFVGGSKTKFQNFIDWNMEYSGILHWPAGNSAIVTKTTEVKESGLRSLSVDVIGATVLDQQMTPSATDQDLLSYYRMTEDTTATGTRVPGLVFRNHLIDGDMNQTGVASWTAVTATLSKQSGAPYSGRLSLRVVGAGGNVGWARQARIISGREYNITGWAKSVDASSAPRIRDTGATRWTGTSSTSWQAFDVTWTAGSTGDIDLGSDTVDGSVEFDAVRLEDTAFMNPGATPANTTPVTTPLIEGLEFVPASVPLVEIIDDATQNGDFASATGWVTGTGWSIGSGVATYSSGGAGNADLSQAGASTLAGLIVPGGLYRVTFTVDNFSGGATVQPKIGGTSGTIRSTANTYVENIRAGTANDIVFNAVVGAGGGGLRLDDVFVELIDESLWHENLTIEALVKFDNDATAEAIVSNSRAWPDGSHFNLLVSNAKFVLSCFIGGTNRESTTGTFETDRYYFVEAIRKYDGTDTTLSIYVDNVLAASNSWTGAPDVTKWEDPWIGKRSAGSPNYLDGIIADHVSFYATDKDSTWVAAQFAAYQAALLAGPYSSQELSPEVTDARTLTADTWAIDDTTGDPFPLILAKTPSDVWEVAFVGEKYSDDPMGLNKATFSLPDGIKEVRLYCKNAVRGAVAFDDVTIDNAEIERIDILTELKDKLLRLLLGAKPIHSWAGLLIDWAVYGAGASAGSSTVTGSGTVV